MVRGSIIPECDDTILLEAFSKYAQVKDIRMIRDKTTGELRDFAFIEFFTLKDAGYVMACTKREPLILKGKIAHVTYSKVKKGEMPHVLSSNIKCRVKSRITIRIYLQAFMV